MLPSLKGSELFKDVDPEESRYIGSKSFLRHFRDGAVIFSAHDIPDRLYVVKEGRVKISHISIDGKEMILHILGPDSVFGAMVFTEGMRNFTAQAHSDVAVYMFKKDDFIDILKRVPAVSLNFIQIISRRLVKIENELARFGHSWSFRRILIVLKRLTEEHGRGDPQEVMIPFRLTHEELANMAGVTRETVSVKLRRLKHEGILSMREGHYIIDVHRLRDYMEHKPPG